jgi:hypothetical protein
MKNNKAVLSLLIIAVLFIGGFVTKQVFTQLSLNFPFSKQVAKVSSGLTGANVTNSGNLTVTNGPGRGGGATDSGPGWTTLVPSATSHIVYIAANGNDSNNCVYTDASGSRPFGGSDYSNPTNTITPCRSLSIIGDVNDTRIRNGQDDFFLLKRGDVWNGEAIRLRKDGFSPTRKQVIGSWAPASAPSTVRPTLNVTSGTPIYSYELRRNLAITDLHLYLNVGPTAPVTGSSGIFISANDALFENLWIERFEFGLISTHDYGGRPSNITIRRNVINDAFCSNRCAGFLSDGDHYLVEQNVFDHNGMIGNLNGYTSSIFNHNGYMSFHTGDGTDTIARENFFMRGASGAKLGSINGGVIDNNTFHENSIGVLECCEDGQIVKNNIVIGGLDLNSTDKRGVGIDIGNSHNVTVDNNILAHQQRGTDNGEGFWVGSTQNTTVSNNVFYDWCLPNSTGLVGFAMFIDAQNPSSLVISNNEFQQKCQSGQQGRIYKGTPIGPTYRNNKYYVDGGTTGTISSPQGYLNSAPPVNNYAQWVSASGETGSSFSQVNYVDPNRDGATYMTSLGLGTYAFGSQSGLDAFAMRLRQYSKWNDDPRLTAAAFNDYIRCGFNKAPLSGSCTGGGGGGDTQAPQVSITAPTNGSSVINTRVITANATDNVGVTRVEFFVDGTRIGADITPSNGSQYSFSWITSGYANGTHTLVAKAYDAATNVGTSMPVSVTVNNTLSTACQRIDADHNLIFNSNDFTTFLNLFQTGNMAAADIDNNNILNANDFQAFLNGYAQCHV